MPNRTKTPNQKPNPKQIDECKLSALEINWLRLWRTLGNGCEPESQVQFHPTRKWRFDFAFPSARLAIELQGGLFKGGKGGGTGKGGHNNVRGFIRDCDKFNAAQELGWTVLKYTQKHLDERPVQSIEQVRRVLDGCL